MGRVTRKLVWVAGVVALAVCLAAAYAAYMLAGYSWDQVVSYRSAFAKYEPVEVPSVPSREASETAPRVVLVICDGLTLDASRQMTGLNTLRQYGADVVASVPQPSLSFPTWTNILSGAPPDISGVTTNWFEGRVPVETLLDVALSDGRRLAVAAPEDFKMLYGAERAGSTYFDEWTDEYMTATYIDQALAMAKTYSPELLIIHLPDADEIAHDHGTDSDEYARVTGRMDGDLSRLVEGLQDPRTMFVICADHGHIASGGHGGWEESVIRAPAVFAGPGTKLGSGTMSQSDIAPTVAAFLGMPIPAQSAGRVNVEAIVDADDEVVKGLVQSRAFARGYLKTIGGDPGAVKAVAQYADIDAALAEGREARMANDRTDRLLQGLGLAGAGVLALVALFATSWRGGLSALAGTAAYYAVYNALYFVLHGYRWSLSAFNTEEMVQSFFYGRMAEAAVSMLVGVAVAGAVYPLLRPVPKGPRDGYLGGWLALGPATVLATLATLALQVGWFLWAWGAEVVWRLPDLKWGFKYDLDLTQATAVGAMALVAPLVTYLVGRYHPRVRTVTSEEQVPHGDS